MPPGLEGPPPGLGKSEDSENPDPKLMSLLKAQGYKGSNSGASGKKTLSRGGKKGGNSWSGGKSSSNSPTKKGKGRKNKGSGLV